MYYGAGGSLLWTGIVWAMDGWTGGWKGGHFVAMREKKTLIRNGNDVMELQIGLLERGIDEVNVKVSLMQVCGYGSVELRITSLRVGLCER